MDYHVRKIGHVRSEAIQSLYTYSGLLRPKTSQRRIFILEWLLGDGIKHVFNIKKAANYVSLDEGFSIPLNVAFPYIRLRQVIIIFVIMLINLSY